MLRRAFPKTARRVLTAVLLVGFLAVGVASVAPRLDTDLGPPDVEALISLLRVPNNKAKVVGHMTPGGEMIQYSWPMKQLIEIGDDARRPLHRRITDEGIQNEVALILGSIGDESTIPLLIDAFPEPEGPDKLFDYENPDPAQVKFICFTVALNQLTRQYIGQTRFRTEFEPGTRAKWQDWWAKSHKTFWVRDNSPSPNRRLKTVPQILTQLDAAVRDEDPAVRTAAAHGYAHLRQEAKPSIPLLIEALRDTDPEVRDAVVSAFYWIGPDAAAAIPALLDVLRSDPVENVRWSAQGALSKIGEAALPHFVAMLTDPSPEIRRRAIAGIGAMEPRQTWILPTFHWLARDADPDIRYTALGYMSVIAPDDPCVFAALVAGLTDPVAAVRRGCAYDLSRLGPNASPATEALVGLLRDKDAGVREQAIEALLKIRSLARAPVPLLIDLLADESWVVRADAADGLSQIGADARAAVPALLKGLTDSRENLRWWSATALGNIGPDAKPAVPLLLEALGDEEYMVRSMAGDALKKIDPEEAARAGVR